MRSPPPQRTEGKSEFGVVDAVLTLGLVGVLLAVAPGVVLEFDVTPKLAILLGSTAALLLCWNAWWPGAATLIRIRRGRLFAGLIGANIGAAIISTIFSKQPQLSLGGSSWHRYGLVTQVSLALYAFLAAACLTRRRRALGRILLGLTYTSGLLSLYAISQYLGWDPILDRSLYTVDYGGDLIRPPATLGHAVYLGTLLAATLPLTVGMAAREAGRRRFVFWIIAGLSIVAAILSGSRSALIAMASAAMLIIITIGHSRRRRALALSGIVLLGSALVVLLVAESSAGSSLRRRLAQWRQDSLGGTRLLLWRDSISMLPDHAAVGYGPEVFGIEFRRRQSIELSRAYPDIFHEAPHNFLIETAFSEGACGLVAIIGLCCLGLVGRFAEDDSMGPWLQASATGIIVTLLFVTLTVVGGMLLYTLLALLVATRSQVSQSPLPRINLVTKIASGCIALILLLSAACYWYEDRGFSAVAEAAQSRSLDQMLRSYDSLADMWFPASRDDLWCSRQFAKIAIGGSGASANRAWAGAAAASSRAELATDNPADAFYQSAMLAFSRNDAVSGERKLRQAIESAPNWYRPHLVLAQLLKVIGRIAESESETRRAIYLSGALKPDIQRALSSAASGAN